MDNHERVCWTWCTLALILSILIIALVGINKAHGAQPDWVIDDAKIFKQSEMYILTHKLAEIQNIHSVTVVLHTAASLSGQDIREYGIAKARGWKIGNKENRGILIIVAMAEKKWAIEVGYGMEGVITDYQARVLGINYLVPSLAKGQYYNAFANTLNELSQILAKEE